MAGGLMAAANDLRDEVAVIRDAHAEQEERRACTQFVEQVEQDTGLPFERSVRPVPVRQPEPPVYELVPVLEVDAEEERGASVHREDCSRLVLPPVVTNSHFRCQRHGPSGALL